MTEAIFFSAFLPVILALNEFAVLVNHLLIAMTRLSIPWNVLLFSTALNKSADNTFTVFGSFSTFIVRSFSLGSRPSSFCTYPDKDFTINFTPASAPDLNAPPISFENVRFGNLLSTVAAMLASSALYFELDTY